VKMEDRVAGNTERGGRAWRNAATVAGIVWREASRKQEGGAVLFIAGIVLCMLVATKVDGRPEMARVVGELCLAMIWVVTAGLSLGLAARQIPNGWSTRTLPLLLSKPIRRDEYLWGLAIGCGLVNAVAIATCYLGFGLGQMIAGVGISPGLVQGMVLHWCALTLFSSLALSISVLRVPSGLNVGACLLFGTVMLLAARPLHDLIGSVNDSGLGTLMAAAYYLLPHFELLDARTIVAGGGGALPFGVFAASIAYALCASASMLKLGEWHLQRQSLQSE
jgi:hypothetical protein